MTPDLKTLRSVAEGAKDRPYTGYAPEDAWHVDPHDPENVVVYGEYEKHGRAYHGVIDGAFNAAVALHIATFDPPTILSLLDRVEALEERDDLAMQIISENAKLRREAEAMAETVRTLEAERDRLREAAQFVTDAVTTLRQFKREYPMDIDSQSCAEEAIWLALASLAAALNPSTGVGGEAG